MSGLIELDGIELIPVFNLYPYSFAAEGRFNSGSSSPDGLDEWHRHWVDCLADSGIVVEPLLRGGLSVPVSEFAADDLLRRFLEATFRQWGGSRDWLIPNESDEPAGRWAICPEELAKAVGRAAPEIALLLPRVRNLLQEATSCKR